jgi:hypothetical protein
MIITICRNCEHNQPDKGLENGCWDRCSAYTKLDFVTGKTSLPFSYTKNLAGNCPAFKEINNDGE